MKYIIKYSPIISLFTLLFAIGIHTPQFLQISTFIIIAEDAATLFIMSTGIFFVIMLGGIDLSVQSIASLCSVILALCLPQFGYYSFFIAIVIGSIFGLISGYFHVTLKIPSFIATLATGGIAASLSLVITNASSIQILQKEKHYITWITDTSFYIPNEILVSFFILILCWFLINFTKFGRYVTSIGAGEAVAWTSGIDVKLNKYN